MTDDATNDPKTPDADGSEGTQKQEGSTESEVIASYRKRQAGAEAARQVAENRNKELETENKRLTALTQSAADKELSELARQTARAEAAETRAAEAEAKAEARILDARFPNARKDLPEVTDEVRLAKFEAMLADVGATEEPPTPRGTNPAREPGTAAKADKDKSSADIFADLKAQGMPTW